MSNKSLHALTLPRWFQTILNQMGQNWSDPNTQNPVTNVEAHNVLPRAGTGRQSSHWNTNSSNFSIDPSDAVTPIAVYPTPDQRGAGPEIPELYRRIQERRKKKPARRWFGFIISPFFPCITSTPWKGVSDGKFLALVLLVLLGFIAAVALGVTKSFAQPFDEHDPRRNANVIVSKSAPAKFNALKKDIVLPRQLGSERRPGDHHPETNRSLDEPIQPPDASEMEPSDSNQHNSDTKPDQRVIPESPNGADIPSSSDAHPHFIVVLVEMRHIPDVSALMLSIAIIAAALVLFTGIWLHGLNRSHTAVALNSVCGCARRSTASGGSSSRLHCKGLQKSSKSNTQSAGICWQAGGASRTGLVRRENQDAFAVGGENNTHSILVVCDGVGGETGGKEAAEFASQFCLAQIKRRLECHEPSSDLCAQVLADCREAFVKEKKNGLTTAIIGVCEADKVHYAALGDGALDVVHSDGMIQHCLAPHHALDAPSNVITAFLSAKEGRDFTPRQGMVRCEPGSWVLAMSDGASDLLPVTQIASKLREYRSACHQKGINFIAEQFLIQIEQAIDEETGIWLHSDNMTLAIAVSEVSRNEGEVQ